MGSIKSSRFYNNPAIGQAFENLAAAFAPPSGADAAGWATANAKREEAARLAELFDYSKSKNYDQTRADRMGVLGGLYAPTQSFYAVDTVDATARRGQDMTAASSRYGSDQSRIASMYGSDRSYAASRENNTADNARALQTNEADNERALAANAADNARALQDRRMQEAGSLQRFYAEPVKLSQGERAYLPEQTAAATGLPAQLNGADKPMSTDEVAALAMQAMPMGDRQQFVRDKFAPTETQVQGQERRSLRESGALTQDDLVDSIMGSVPVENVVGPDGKTPVVVSRPDAIGKTPFINPGAQAAPQTENWVGPDGKGGTAVFDVSKSQWVDTSTRQPIPAGSRTYTGQLQGGAGETGFGPTTANRTRANEQEAEITRTLGTLDVYEKLINENPGAIGLVGLIRGTAQNAAATTTDLVRSFGTGSPEIVEAANEIKEGLRAVAPNVFDPAIPEAQFIQSTLAYALVRSENPSGEVSRQAYEDALRRVQGGGMLANSGSAKAAISAQRRLLQNQLVGLRNLRYPGTGRTDTGYQEPPAGLAGAPAAPAPAPGGSIERWERGPDGTMRKVQ